MIVFTIAALTLERYFCIKEKKLIENDTSKAKHICIYILVLWFLAICYTLPKAFSIKEEVYQENIIMCGSSMSDFYDKINTILKWIISFVFPYTVIIVNSILLLKFLKEWSQKSNNLTKIQTKTSPSSPLISNTNVDAIQVDTGLKGSKLLNVNPNCSGNNKKPEMQKNNLNKNTRSMMIKRRTTRFVLAIVFSFLCCWYLLISFNLKK